LGEIIRDKLQINNITEYDRICGMIVAYRKAGKSKKFNTGHSNQHTNSGSEM
jgi:hypothetical protein